MCQNTCLLECMGIAREKSFLGRKKDKTLRQKNDTDKSINHSWEYFLQIRSFFLKQKFASLKTNIFVSLVKPSTLETKLWMLNFTNACREIQDNILKESIIVETTKQSTESPTPPFFLQITVSSQNDFLRHNTMLNLDYILSKKLYMHTAERQHH